MAYTAFSLSKSGMKLKKDASQAALATGVFTFVDKSDLGDSSELASAD